MAIMDSTGGELTHAAHELSANIERRQSHDTSSTAALSGDNVVGEKQEQDLHSSGSSSEDITKIEKLDSHIVKVPEAKKGDEAYQHLPPHEREIIKRQLDIPTVTVSFSTLFRYATKVDLVIILISCICAIAGGAVLPLMTVGIWTRRCEPFS